jgi:hypothetical protein
MPTLERIRVALAGVAAGLMIAVFYLHGSAVDSDQLNELRDGALLLLLVSVGLSVWQNRTTDKQHSS